MGLFHGQFEEILYYVGLLREAQGRRSEALEALERAVRLDDEAFAQGPAGPLLTEWTGKHRLALLKSRLEAGQAAGALEAAEAFAALSERPGNAAMGYHAACALSLCLKGAELTSERREEVAARAIERLRAALATESALLDQVAVDPDLAGLAGRRDFQELVLDPVFPALLFGP